MSNIVQLDNTVHGALRLVTGRGDEFGEAVSRLPVFVSEFDEVQRHYPILFRKDADGKLGAIAVLGFENDENLFLERGEWDGYVPAIVRRGPLAIGRGDDGQRAIMIDLDHPRLRDGGSDGAPLFREHGGDAPALEAATVALNQVRRGMAAAEAMQRLFEELKLVEPIKLEVQVSDSKAINFEGFLVVNGERIGELTGDELAQLSHADLLAPAIFAASSLANIRRLVVRKRLRESPA